MVFIFLRDIFRRIVEEIEAELKLVEANKKLIEIYKRRIQAKLAEIWSEENAGLAGCLKSLF